MYLSVALSICISVFLFLSLSISLLPSVWRILSLPVNLFMGFPVFLSLWVLFFFYPCFSFWVFLFLCILLSLCLAHAFLHLLCPPLRISPIHLFTPHSAGSHAWLPVFLFLSFSLPVIFLCIFSLDIVCLSASLCLHFSFGIRVSCFPWLMLCVCLLSSALPCSSLIFSYGNQAFSAWLVIQPSQIFSPSPNDKRPLCWVQFNNLDEV